MLIGIPVVFIGCVLLFFALVIFWAKPGQIDFYLHKGRYERIVDMAKQSKLEPCGEQNLQKCVDGYQVHVSNSDASAYTVTIVSVDMHHAGSYGYIYQDKPQAPRPDPNYPDKLGVDNPGNLLFYGKDILWQEGRWRTAYNNLD